MSDGNIHDFPIKEPLKTLRKKLDNELRKAAIRVLEGEVEHNGLDQHKAQLVAEGLGEGIDILLDWIDKEKVRMS